ncbi:Pvc16 family protein [Streptomyces sp. NB004]
MIHEVDEVLKTLLKGGAMTGSGIDVAFEAPTRDWAARRNAPVINTYLYDIREDVNRRQRGQMAVRDEDAIIVKRRQPPRWFRLSYLVTAWTKTPQDEHRLLSAVMATLLPRELLPPSELPGSLGALGLSVPLTVAGIQTEARSLAEIWSALGGELKPSLDLVVTAPFPAFPECDAGPPVTEGATVRVGGIEGDPPMAEGRSHRPHQVAAARAARRGPADRGTGRP